MAAHSEERRGWRGHVGWLVGHLIVVFAGVSAAFVVENYRDNRNQAAEFRQALSGVVAELSRVETRGREFADGIDAKVSEWGAGLSNWPSGCTGLLSDPRSNTSANRSLEHNGDVRFGSFD